LLVGHIGFAWCSRPPRSANSTWCRAAAAAMDAKIKSWSPAHLGFAMEAAAGGSSPWISERWNRQSRGCGVRRGDSRERPDSTGDGGGCKGSWARGLRDVPAFCVFREWRFLWEIASRSH
jgi:hypothetical protein